MVLSGEHWIKEKMNKISLEKFINKNTNFKSSCAYRSLKIKYFFNKT